MLQFGGADICINNAGLGHYATLLSGSSAMWREMFEVNKYYNVWMRIIKLWKLKCCINWLYPRTNDMPRAHNLYFSTDIVNSCYRNDNIQIHDLYNYRSC